MAKRKQNEPPKNDFAPNENEEMISFTSEPIALGQCISSFSFDDDDIEAENITVTNANNDSCLESNNTTPNISSNNKATSKNGTIAFNNNILTDNRKASVANGMAPPIDGEFLDTKRTYMLRASTVRKINELKSIHPDLNTYVSTIVDLAIAHYYNYIVNEGGNQ
ncbi:hypothetical protein C1H57_23530 [Clostridium sp. 2-1]|uniref:hypothetical protein n=1 Tax=Clostridium TaxID=1485 RepID=UPI000CDB67A9|nr:MULTISPECIES: hypothetical protein [Clostridium]MBN7572797.1 hypothetical protein [Clostridium beijerinckii]MBN7578137.1 hypothetical protein [Clostridium beijerinckii]MBN7582571.1 hypothetical protein [Clostridium beijerinckii]MBO0521811.1 hypothetical protein [Clostridium beijerinckii]POO88899.1 hypothetical protein C1H57_23530 [Clostridium sp. 2-1]